MKRFLVVFLSLCLLACSEEKKQGNMVVKGQIQGLKKGTLYLQKMRDTTIISVDSISLLGKDVFSLSDHIESPEMYYLTFDANTSEQKIMFFAEPGIITINDKLSNFGVQTEITG